ncbi:hypothetical protein PFICI_13735 [Pestalotiopsis fici W106-1]|uniref:Uncharacterized protein n=1 Tax=Pestalotiopsis fici (strain W106-1 / CGMCC3.15140) TaxID=1229662 RepID=W3WR11_PESFW|nr:uncharacterized protein PFICI_13735 [Pestalotiopsis fici W106-1]ETS75251.1 hypothetical protein PFICI_13735 [Pestalotiopsis fici W106-1]
MQRLFYYQLFYLWAAIKERNSQSSHHSEVITGVKDLPPSSEQQSRWDKKKNPDAPTRHLTNTPRSKYPRIHSARKAGQPAFVRARLDKTNRRVPQDYVGATGKLASVAYITFNNGGSHLTSDEMFRAYCQADAGRERIITQWNYDPCVFLSQKALYNSSN